MSQWQGNPNDPGQYPNTIRPGDPIPEGSVIGNSELWRGQQKPPKKKHTGLKIAAGIVGGLFALIVIAGIAGGGSPDAKAPVTVTSQAGTPVDNGPTPEPVVTPTNKPSASSKPSPKVTHKPAPKLTASQEQAVGTAQDYLSYSSFSRKGLIGQLKFEGFSAKDATFAVDSLKVNWNEQAVGVAKGYLDTQHFSRSGLIGQLEFDGFTHSQAVYGVTKAGL